MTDVLLTLVSLALQLAAHVARPTHARCPVGWRLDGVARDGTYACDRPARGGWQGDDEALLSVRSLVYCTGGSEPINVNGVDVACQARH